MPAANLLVIFHIAFAALWLGAPLFIRSTLKQAEPHGAPAFRGAAAVAAKAATFTGAGAAGALLTGVGMIFLRYGGMKGLPVRFHVALGLVLVGCGVVFGLLRPAVGKVVAAAETGADAATLAPLYKKIAMGTGIGHLIWLVSLVLMYAN